MAQDDLQRMIEEEVKKLQSGNNVQDPPPATELKINVGGQERTFSSPEALQEYVNQTLEATTRAAQTAVQNAVASLPGQRQTADDLSTQPKGPVIDLEEYAKALKEDPFKAHQMVEAARWGGADPVGLMREIIERQQAAEQVLAAYQFRDLHPEFQRTPENAQALFETVNAHRLPMTVEGLEMALAVAQKQGKIVTVDESSYIEEPVVNQRGRGNLAPPSVGRRGTTEELPSYLEQVEEMDAESIRKLIEKFDRGGR